MKLTQQQWDAKTPVEKLHFLTEGATELRKQHAVNGKAKVGEAMVMTLYSVVMNGVTLGENRSASVAFKDTAEFLKSLEDVVDETPN